MDRRDLRLIAPPAGLVVALITTLLLFRTHIIGLPVFAALILTVLSLMCFALWRLSRRT